MLKQLSQLTIEADGRYASAGELDFLRNYLNSADLRLSAYKKIRDHEEDIIYGVEIKKKASLDFNFFKMGTKDVSSICRRDVRMVLCIAAADMLFGDFDRLREGMLVWFETIGRAFGFQKYSLGVYKMLQETVQQYLTPEEYKLIEPGLVLTQSIMSQS